MSNYVKSKKGYQKIKFDAKSVKKAYQKRKEAKKFPTSINLSEDTVTMLKTIAQKRGIPYQTLMRMLIVEGLERMSA